MVPWPRTQAAKTTSGIHRDVCASPPAFYSIPLCCVTKMRISDDCTVMIQEIRVKAADGVSLRPSGKYFYKFCLGMPKYVSNGLGLSGGGRVYLSMQNDKTHTMTRDRISDGGTQVALNESVTKRYNGRTYTTVKFVLPSTLANRLNVYKGKE